MFYESLKHRVFVQKIVFFWIPWSHCPAQMNFVVHFILNWNGKALTHTHAQKQISKTFKTNTEREREQRMTFQYLFSCFPNKPFTTMTVPNQDSFKRNFGTEQMTCNTHNRRNTHLHTHSHVLIWLLLFNTHTSVHRL